MRRGSEWWNEGVKMKVEEKKKKSRYRISIELKAQTIKI